MYKKEERKLLGEGVGELINCCRKQPWLSVTEILGSWVMPDSHWLCLSDFSGSYRIPTYELFMPEDKIFPFPLTLKSFGFPWQLSSTWGQGEGHGVTQSWPVVWVSLSGQPLLITSPIRTDAGPWSWCHKLTRGTSRFLTVRLASLIAVFPVSGVT